MWREFYHAVLANSPRVLTQSFRPEYDALDWVDDDEGFEAWKAGRTGYSFVDAGMRQLRATGWMHNRLRMVVASFLTKDLLIDWRRGERYFYEALVDGDPASNNGGWQWAASTGTDAQPYFRIFNPVAQGERFDPEGRYVKRWIPELRGLPADRIHAPWRKGDPPSGYPRPIVDHGEARLRALAGLSKSASGLEQCPDPLFAIGEDAFELRAHERKSEAADGLEGEAVLHFVADARRGRRDGLEAVFVDPEAEGAGFLLVDEA